MKTSKILLTSVCCAVIGAVTAQAATAPVSRMWTDTKGRQVEATFQAIDGDNIILQTKDGTMHKFPLTNLSAEDQQIAQSAKASAPAQVVAIDSSIAQAASKIDYLVAKGVVRANPQRAKDGLPPITSYNPLTSDEQFVRRIYLDVVGRIPSHDEALAFLQDSSPTKRAKLIDMLLDSEGYNSHMFNYLADMMRVTENFDNNNVRGVPYIKWLKDQVSANEPWDKVVHKMMVTDGKMWGEEKDSAATGYLLRDSGMPLDNLANTLTIFLGTDVACAQCHDHPFADWTQKQFYEMASFFGATTTRLNGRDFEGGDRGMMLMTEAEKIIEANGGDLRQIRNGLQNFIGANRAAVMDRKENMMKLPHDYKYKDGKPGDPVKPKFITWAKSDASNPAYKQNKKAEERLRDSFAAWMTHKDNPRFAMTIANRLWKRAFGSAVAEPVTNIDDPKNATNPELLLHLTTEMKRLGFNLKNFQRLIYNTKAYQAEATTEAIAMGTPYYFQGPQLRRMSAEQTWDSYMTLMLGNPDTRKKPVQDLYSRAIDLNLANPKLDAKTVLMKYEAFRNIGKTQAAMMNSDAEGGDSMMMEGNMMGGRGGRGMEYFRASELTQPARDGHFLTEFGQSRRLLIDGGSKVGSVPQVLMLMNGSAQEMLTQSGSPVLKQIEAAKTPEEKVDTLFLSVMSRKPTANEQTLAKREVETSGSEAFPNLVWALINTREFIFVQ
jgi:hypothetical protein